MKKISHKLVGLICVTSFVLCNIACAMGKKPLVDPVTPSSILSGDATVVMQGCDRAPSVGVAYCRVSEGSNAGQFLVFIAPASKCNQDNCAYFKVWNAQGILVWGGSIPKGQTSVKVDWKVLLGRDDFQAFDRGFWTVNESLFWIADDGFEHQSNAQGDIILRVYKKDYVPLQNVSNDPNFSWVKVNKDFTYKFTSSLRAYVGETNSCGRF